MTSLSGETPIIWFDSNGNKRMLPWAVPYGVTSIKIKAGNSVCRLYLYGEGGTFLDIHYISSDETYSIPSSVVAFSFETDAVDPSADGFSLTMYVG